jgi:soluble lytic murein transglycosylase
MKLPVFLKWIAFVILLVTFPLNKLFAAARQGDVLGLVRKLTQSKKFTIAEWKVNRISQAIYRESRRYQIDPLLVVAVIEHESRFNPTTRGSHGEIGLMQIKPATAAWICQVNQTPWHGAMSLEDPVINIELGTAYLAMMKERFSKRQFYLAAYNAGPGNIRRQIRQRSVPRHYAFQVMRNYRRFHGELSRG